MKQIVTSILVGLVVFACSTTNSLSDKSFKDSLVGKNEIELFELLGAPSRVLFARGGEKVMIYESTNVGTFLTPNKSKIAVENGLPVFRSVDTRTNDPKYAIYPKEVRSFKLYLNTKGKCVRYEEIQINEQSDSYHQRFKHFSPENR